MSELKVINAYQLTTNTEDCDVYIHNDEFGCGGDLVECYLKSEVDRYISELIADQQLELDEWYCCAEHQKRKRCLAMAKYCKAMCGHYLSYEEPKWFWYRKWSGRWLELAEKFKEDV